jgi:hypothetical protein
VEGAASRRFGGGWCDWCHVFVDPAVGGGAERIDGGHLWCGLCPRFPATEALHDAARFARRAQRLLRSLSRSGWMSSRPTSTCSLTPLPTSGWSSISDMGDARRPPSTAAKDHRDDEPVAQPSRTRSQDK